MSSKFDPEYYSLYRPHYPLAVFSGLKEYFSHRTTRLNIVDLGCGTGHSTRSALELNINADFTAIDIDPEMIAWAKQTTDAPIHWIVASGENTTLRDRSVDCLLIGSAFHWFDRSLVAQEFDRILKPDSLLRIFEYQFPKAVQNPELNEWIRREFNLNWKAPNQKPRGTLKEMADVLLKTQRFSLHREGQPEMKMELDATELQGQILSQSRVLHYLDTLAPREKNQFKESLSTKIHSLIRPNEVFDFKLSWIEFKAS